MDHHNAREAALARTAPLEVTTAALDGPTDTTTPAPHVTHAVQCRGCGAALPQNPNGRPRDFCSSKCRQRAYRGRASAALVEGFRNASVIGAHEKAIPRPEPAPPRPRPVPAAPLDLIGGGHRWRGAVRLDSDLRRQIVALEMGADHA